MWLYVNTQCGKKVTRLDLLHKINNIIKSSIAIYALDDSQSIWKTPHSFVFCYAVCYHILCLAINENWYGDRGPTPQNQKKFSFENRKSTQCPLHFLILKSLFIISCLYRKKKQLTVSINRRRREEYWQELIVLGRGWTLLHGNAPAHIALSVKSFLAPKNVILSNHPPYSAVLSPADFFLFSKLKERRFGSTEHVRKTMRRDLNAGISKDFFSIIDTNAVINI